MKSEENKKDLSEILQLVSFHLGKEEFGIDILSVREIIKMINITRVPNAPEFVEGVINLRGRIIPVVYLRTRLGMLKKEIDKDTRIVVVELSDKTIGFIVDAVKEVIRIPKELTEEPPDFIGNVNSEHITSVAKLEDNLLIILDLEKVFNLEEVEVS